MQLGHCDSRTPAPCSGRPPSRRSQHTRRLHTIGDKAACIVSARDGLPACNRRTKAHHSLQSKTRGPLWLPETSRAMEGRHATGEPITRWLGSPLGMRAHFTRLGSPRHSLRSCMLALATLTGHAALSVRHRSQAATAPRAAIDLGSSAAASTAREAVRVSAMCRLSSRCSVAALLPPTSVRRLRNSLQRRTQSDADREHPQKAGTLLWVQVPSPLDVDRSSSGRLH